MKTRLIFVRHAEAEGNVIRRFHGWTDSALTERGHLQAQRVAERLKDIPVDVIYSSSLQRTKQTASYISKVKNLPVYYSDELKEIHGGDWEGLTWQELEERWPQAYDIWDNRPHLHQMPNGESMAELQQRALDIIMNIIKLNQGKNICIVTHGTLIRTVICHFRACTLDEMINVAWCDNTGITIVDYENDVFSIETEGDSAHLGSDLGTISNQDWWKDYINKFRGRE